MLSPADGNTIPEVLDSTAHELQLNLGFGQHHHPLPPSITFNPQSTSVNHETVPFLEHLPQPAGGSKTRGKNVEAEGRIKRLKRERDRRYREKEKEIKEKQTHEICKLKEQNAILQEELSKHKEKDYHLGREIASCKEKILQLQAEIIQLESTVERQTVTAEVVSSQPVGSKAVDLEKRYEKSKCENALLKKQLKKGKRMKKVMEKALLDRIVKLESMGRQDIEPSSSYVHSEHSSM